jgi:ribonuclease E
MLDDDNTAQTQPPQDTSTPARRRRRAASRPAGPPEASGTHRPPEPVSRARDDTEPTPSTQPAPPTPTMAVEPTPDAAASAADTSLPPTSAVAEPTRKPAKRSRRKAAAPDQGPEISSETPESDAPSATASRSGRSRRGSRSNASRQAAEGGGDEGEIPADADALAVQSTDGRPTQDAAARDEAAQDDPAHDEGSDGTATERSAAAPASPVALLFRAPDPVTVPSRAGGPDRSEQDGADSRDAEASTDGTGRADTTAPDSDQPDGDSASGPKEDGDGAGTRRRRSRGGRKRGKSATDGEAAASDAPSRDSTLETGSAAGGQGQDAPEGGRDDEESGSSHRRRRRRRGADDSGEVSGDATPTTVRVRAPRAKKETITSVEGSTRIEAKKQRRREGREAGRRRPPILSESEFLARRESVERVMAIRQRGEMTQIGVLEDGILVEHYVALESQSSLIGNVYIGRVQNVLPSMEAAFIDIGKGRNAVLYAGEVNWDVLGGTNQPRRIENALKPGQTVLVQVSKDPVGHKGARLTSQITLPGRYLVYVPGGGTSGISRKLADTERSRLKTLISDILPDSAGVIIRTAAEGASEEELTRDVTRLTARWEDIQKKVKAGQAPALVYGEPDTTIRVVRDLFTEDFSKLIISGDDAWDMVNAYVQHVAPDLIDRIERYEGDGDVFGDLRIEEQIAKALDRKVWLPSGGSLVIDRTEAMTVVDVNTGKFTGSGGNLEETVTKNNLEAAEEIVRQLRLRDIGGIIVVDFIDMVLEDNRDLVLRRLVECLGRDRTRHQVAEVTSLGLVQMTRKRISTGLIEAFSHPCEVCHGRGVVIEDEPVLGRKTEEAHAHSGHAANSTSRSSKRSSNRRRGGAKPNGDDEPTQPDVAEQTTVDQPAVDVHVEPPGSDTDSPAEANGSAPDAAVLTEVAVGP